MCSGWCLSRNSCCSKIIFGKHHSVNLRNSHPPLISVLAKAVITREPMAARLESIKVDKVPVLQGGHLKRGTQKLLTGVKNICTQEPTSTSKLGLFEIFIANGKQ